MSEKTILLAGAFGFGNVGDDAIALATSTLLQETAPDTQVIALGGSPARLRQATGLSGYPLGWRSPMRAAQLVKLVRSSDAVLIGGGGLLQDMLPHFYRPYFLLALTAKTLGKPVMFYSVGAYPPRTRMFREMSQVVLNRADVVTVRDEFSAQGIAAAGVRRRVVVTADPAITLRAPAVGPLIREGMGPVIAVSLRPWYHLPALRSRGDPGRFMETLAHCLDSVVEATHGHIFFFPMHIGAADDDLKMQWQVFSRMQHGEAVGWIARRCPLDVLAAIGGCDLMIGMRLHANILAAAAGVPSIALAYDPKVSQFMRRLGCADQVLSLERLRPADVAEKAVSVLNDREQVVRRMSSTVKTMAASARECAAAAIKLANGVNPAGVWNDDSAEREWPAYVA
jgi:polysaccharide pyruvyl transferase CsaB